MLGTSTGSVLDGSPKVKKGYKSGILMVGDNRKEKERQLKAAKRKARDKDAEIKRQKKEREKEEKQFQQEKEAKEFIAQEENSGDEDMNMSIHLP